MAEAPLLNGMHVVLGPQQKFAGRPCPHAVKFVPILAHTSDCLVKRPITSAASTAAVRAIVEGTKEDMRHTAVSLRSTDVAIVSTLE